MAQDQLKEAKSQLVSIMEQMPERVTQDGTTTTTHDPLRMVQATKEAAQFCASVDPALSVNPFLVIRQAKIVSCNGPSSCGDRHPMIR